MKAFTVKFHPSAMEDLEDIFIGILEKSQNYKTAQGYTDRIQRQCVAIGRVPMGYPEKPEIHKGLRIVPFEDSAVIFYYLRDETVWISNIFGKGIDYQTVLLSQILGD